MQDALKLVMNLRFDPKKDPLHGRILLLALHFFKEVFDPLPEFVSSFITKQLLPVVLLEFLSVCILTLIVRLDHISSLVLKEEPFGCRVEHLLVHSVHLLALDQIDNVEVVSQLLLASFKCLMSPLCL